MNCPHCDGTGTILSHFTCEVCKGRKQTTDEGLASLWARRHRKALRLDRVMRANAIRTAQGFEKADRDASAD